MTMLIYNYVIRRQSNSENTNSSSKSKSNTSRKSRTAKNGSRRKPPGGGKILYDFLIDTPTPRAPDGRDKKPQLDILLKLDEARKKAKQQRNNCEL